MGYEGAADGDSCGWEGIFPQGTLARIESGKENEKKKKYFFLLSTKQEFSECTAHLYRNIPL